MATYSCGIKVSSCKQACVRLLTFIPWYHTYSKRSMRPRQIPCRLLPDAAVYRPCRTPYSRMVCIFPAVHLRSDMPDLLSLRSLAYCISFWHQNASHSSLSFIPDAGITPKTSPLASHASIISSTRTCASLLPSCVTTRG